MPVHEKQSQYANDYAKVGLAGRAGGRVEALGSAEQVEYALGDISPAQTATAPGRYTNRPTGLAATSPAIGTIRVTFTNEPPETGVTDYAVYRGATQIGTQATGAQTDYTGQPTGTHTVTVRSRDDDGTEFTESSGASVTVA